MSAPRPPEGKGFGSVLNSREFVPYVYGASLGRPSRGRPEKVLAAGLAADTTARMFERELDAPAPKYARRDPPQCGTEGGARRHYRLRQKPCEACHRAERAADARRRGATTCQACHAVLPDHFDGCGYLEMSLAARRGEAA